MSESQPEGMLGGMYRAFMNDIRRTAAKLKPVPPVAAERLNHISVK